MEKSVLELLLSQGLSVERIGKRFGKDPSTISYWMHKHGLDAPNAGRHAPRGALERERLVALVDRGLSIREIAAEVDRSAGTVRHWMRLYGLRTVHAVGRRRPELADGAKEVGTLITTMRCSRHGEVEFILEGRGYYRCKRCRADNVSRHRRKLKQILVTEAGGRSRVCGYDRSLRALEFHHLDPREKRLGLSSNGVTLSLDVLRAESRKCVLLCANCHAEVEDGALVLPLEFSAGSVSPIILPGASPPNTPKSGVAQSAEQTAVNR